MSESKDIYALTYEYSYANNNDGRSSPDDAGGILGIYEDEDDAESELERLKDGGDWGDFSDPDSNDGWSEGGYILGVDPQTVIPSSKGKA